MLWRSQRARRARGRCVSFWCPPDASRSGAGGGGLTVRYDRHAAAVTAFLHLACTLICLRYLRRAEAG